MLFKKNEKKPKEKAPRDVSIWREYGEMIVEVMVFVFFINTFLLQSQAIPTPSMVDTMLIGDHLLVNKAAHSPHFGTWDSFMFPPSEIKRGSIITFKGPTEMEKDYVKRVIALPGDTIRIVDKNVYINGRAKEEPYLYFENGFRLKPGDRFPLDRPRIIDALGNTSYLPFYMQGSDGHIDREKTVALCEKFKDSVIIDKNSGKRVFKVPKGHYFCMGDNRDNSYDSRFWGPVPESYILGKPWRIYWSFESTTEEYLTEGLWYKIKDIVLTFSRFFSKTRWNRTFKKFE